MSQFRNFGRHSGDVWTRGRRCGMGQILGAILIAGWGLGAPLFGQAPSPPDELTIALPSGSTTATPPSAPSASSVLAPLRETGIGLVDFHQPVAEIPDLPAAEQGWMGALKTQASASVNGILESGAEGGWGTKLKNTLGQVNLQKVAGSLAIVLGGYLGFVWFMRRVNGGRVGGLPREVVEVMGHAPFGPKKNLQLVRLGSKLLLLLHSPEGTPTIGEINDASEVEYLSGVCSGKKPAAANTRRTQPATRRPSAGSSVRPEVSVNAEDLERVIRKLAASAQSDGGNVFEA